MIVLCIVCASLRHYLCAVLRLRQLYGSSAAALCGRVVFLRIRSGAEFVWPAQTVAVLLLHWPRHQCLRFATCKLVRRAELAHSMHLCLAVTGSVNCNRATLTEILTSKTSSGTDEIVPNTE